MSPFQQYMQNNFSKSTENLALMLNKDFVMFRLLFPNHKIITVNYVIIRTKQYEIHQPNTASK